MNSRSRTTTEPTPSGNRAARSTTDLPTARVWRIVIEPSGCATSIESGSCVSFIVIEMPFVSANANVFANKNPALDESASVSHTVSAYVYLTSEVSIGSAGASAAADPAGVEI
eukprot:Amastigsp_a508448_208.p4 type:complete len:113 gc:universal Amastigsp_a508448_208:889-1227(+)